MPEPDDHVVDQLREVFEAVDAPPPQLVDAAKASIAWRTVDAELAELVSDSSTEPAAAVRATEPTRLLTFSSGDTLIVIEVANERRTRRVIGQVVAPSVATIEVRHADGVVSVSTDADGRFRASPVAAGPISVCCRFDDPHRASVVTSWVSI